MANNQLLAIIGQHEINLANVTDWLGVRRMDVWFEVGGVRFTRLGMPGQDIVSITSPTIAN